MTSHDLTDSERRRYARHLTLPDVGIAGQRRLRDSRVCVVGMGGLGSPATLYLAAAGVGTLVLVDFDSVDESNLQRQILHGESDIARRKVDSARETLCEINPRVHTIAFAERLTADNVSEITAACDVVVDGSDDFATRYVVGDACHLARIPVVHGSVYRWEGQVTVFDPLRESPCYRCLFPNPPPAGESTNCADAGVFGVLPGVIGSLQASETIKILLGIGEPLAGRILHFDARAARFREMKLARNPSCPLCGDNPTIHHIHSTADMPCASDAPTQAMEGTTMLELGAKDLQTKLERGDDFILLDVREPHELAIARYPESDALRHIPMNEIPGRMAELDPDAEIVVACRSGGRSAQVQAFLKQQGFTRVLNLRGGILAWSDEVDPTVPKY